MNSQIKVNLLKRLLMPLSIFICTIILYSPANAQEHPPKPIVVTVDPLSPLRFGTIIPIGSHGTVTITAQGSRIPLGEVVVLNRLDFSPAIFNVEALPGTNITIDPVPEATLSGSNSGFLTLQIGESYPRSPFVTIGENTKVYIGGMLFVGSIFANPAGEYGGTFFVTFRQDLQ